jgi:hypothetical protein
MTEFNYIKSQATADKLIAKFGGKLKGKIIRTPVGSGPKSNPGKGAPVEYPCTCVVVNWDKGRRIDSEAERNTQRMLVSPLGLTIELELSDKIQAPDGKVYKILPPMNVLKPQTVIVLYDLTVQV